MKSCDANENMDAERAGSRAAFHGGRRSCDGQAVRGQPGRLRGLQKHVAAVRNARQGAGTLIVSEEALTADADGLLACVAAQPVWSDLPMIVLSRPGANRPCSRRSSPGSGMSASSSDRFAPPRSSPWFDPACGPAIGNTRFVSSSPKRNRLSRPFVTAWTRNARRAVKPNEPAGPKMNFWPP